MGEREPTPPWWQRAPLAQLTLARLREFFREPAAVFWVYGFPLVLAAAPSVPVPKEQDLDEPGARYIDFLLPGLIGANLMGGGLWGVGFVTVDMRVRKLLKRFVATPMRRRDFLLSLMLSRLA